MTRTFNSDYSFGRKNEIKVVKYLNENGGDYKLYDDEKHEFDFYDGDVVCELKTRTCFLNTYRTTIFGQNKLDEMTPDKTYHFYFLFRDGLYKWDYNADEYFIDDNGRSDRGRNEYKPHCNIWINDLKLVSKEVKTF